MQKIVQGAVEGEAFIYLYTEHIKKNSDDAL